MATGSKLVIVESPTKAKKIGGYLGSEYTVMASVGHIRDLAQPSQVPAADKTKFGKFGVDVEAVLHRRQQQEENRVRAEKRVEKSRHPVPRNR